MGRKKNLIVFFKTNSIPDCDPIVRPLGGMERSERKADI